MHFTDNFVDNAISDITGHCVIGVAVIQMPEFIGRIFCAILNHDSCKFLHLFYDIVDFMTGTGRAARSILSLGFLFVG